MIRGLLLTAPLLALTACTATSGNFCDIYSPIRLSPAAQAAMDDRDVVAVLTPNEKWDELCRGRKP